MNPAAVCPVCRHVRLIHAGIKALERETLQARARGELRTATMQGIAELREELRLHNHRHEQAVSA